MTFTVEYITKTLDFQNNEVQPWMTIGKCIFTSDWEERDYTSHILDFDLTES